MLKSGGLELSGTNRCATSATDDESTPPLSVAAIGDGLLMRAATLRTSRSRQWAAYSSSE